MRDYIDIGSTPADEPCAQVGSADYQRRGQAECAAYAAQLKRMFPKGTFSVKANSHDFGTYYSVVAHFETDPTTEAQREEYDAAFAAEGKSPEKWDAFALKELARREKQHGGGRLEFKAWMAQVDVAISKKIGLTSGDLPDCCYHDWFDAGDTPKQAASKAIKNAKDDM